MASSYQLSAASGLGLSPECRRNLPWLFLRTPTEPVELCIKIVLIGTIFNLAQHFQLLFQTGPVFGPRTAVLVANYTLTVNPKIAAKLPETAFPEMIAATTEQCFR